MTESRSQSCGCRYIRMQNQWWQVVACPAHRMHFRPLDEIPGTRPDP